MRAFSYILSFFAVAGLPLASAAQTTEKGFYEQYQLEILLGVAAVVCMLALVALVTVLMALKAILRAKNPETKAHTAVAATGTGEGYWRGLWNRLNEAVPIEQEDSIMTSHEYDGIRELDNKLPPWWVYSFYVTIIFAIGYLLHFHVFNTGNLQDAEYDTEMAEARAEVEAYLATLDSQLDETNVTFTSEELDIATGKELFVSKCAACHGAQGEGTVGPNLTDQYWIHGGDIKDIFKTIKYGVPSKGMIAWQSQLTPMEMQQISSFIYTLEGTNPPNAKEPQGELYEKTGGEAEQRAVLEAGL